MDVGKINLAIYGHAHVEVLTYTKEGKYYEKYVAGGAAAIHRFVSRNHPEDLSVIFAGDENFNKSMEYRREYINVYDDDKKKKISHHLGYREGTSSDNIYYVPPRHLDVAMDLMVWDDGLSELKLPDDCCTVLWASNKVLPNKEQFKKIHDKCFLFLNADVLRATGAMITSQISWERTAADLIWQLQNNEALSYLLQAPHLLISFAEDGAVYINNTEKQMKASLVLTHGDVEGSLRENVSGYFTDPFVFMVGSMSRGFTYVFDGSLGDGRDLGRLLEVAEAFMEIDIKLKDETEKNEVIYPVFKDWPAFIIPFFYLENSNQAVVEDDWTVTTHLTNKLISDVAIDYVVKGAEVIEGLPQLSFGALTTIDRWEIESYQNIRNLIVDYVNDDKTRPLSIAVFGSPGSGKSFGVTQIAQNILPGKIEKLEFNVSQFTDLTDLGIAFQKVRDTILGGKLPLVFFDEFDSDRDGLALGWVKNFLMPMQDGAFKDETGIHPVGKCILAFAGGTASSFEAFTQPMNDEGAAYEKFKNIKGPDFISRLRGTINVLGPNPKDEADKNYILRRALLLRSLCERKFNYKQNPTPVSESIIHAMLNVPKYKHGARSMEAILDMSRIDNNKWEPSFLPSYSQLSLHVDADAFLELLLK